MYGEVILAGMLVSFALSYFTGFSPAGLIVPGYIVLAMGSPLKLLWTAVIVALTLGIYKLLSLVTILYGQRRFLVMCLISVALTALLNLIFPQLNISVIGYLIPGLIAKECDRQGVVKTLLVTAVATGITLCIALLFGVKVF